MSADPAEAGAGRIRLDKWLWHARFFKTRGLAARAVSEGVIRLNAQRVVKPATAVAVGDGLTFVQAGRVRVVRVLALGSRRGPASEAQRLYVELSAATADTALARGGSVDK